MRSIRQCSVPRVALVTIGVLLAPGCTIEDDLVCFPRPETYLERSSLDGEWELTYERIADDGSLAPLGERERVVFTFLPGNAVVLSAASLEHRAVFRADHRGSVERDGELCVFRVVYEERPTVGHPDPDDWEEAPYTVVAFATAHAPAPEALRGVVEPGAVVEPIDLLPSEVDRLSEHARVERAGSTPIEISSLAHYVVTPEGCTQSECRSTTTLVFRLARPPADE